jgi:uncharacterized membrane protein
VQLSFIILLYDEDQADHFSKVMKMSGPARYFCTIKHEIMDTPDEKKFIPKGAMAFFILLVLLSLGFWYGIYLLMIERTQN